jgi:Protein of unknown function (DUF3644)
MAPRPRWWHKLQGSKQEALLGVDLYNRSGADRRLEAFVVHMQIAWLYMLQARFERDDVDFHYRDARGHRKKIDGEFMTWDLARCVKEIFPNQNHPVRRNVEFFIGFRNKIEHRYEQLLESVVAGKAQSLIMNYEQMLVDTFGEKESLADRLRFPVFLTSLTDGAVEALKEVHKRLPKRLTKYVSDYDALLGDDVRDDHRYEFRVYLVQQTGPKTEADVSMRFVRFDDLSDEERAQLEQVQTIVRERQVPVANVERHKPSEVCRQISEVLGVRFTPSSDHVRAWKHYEIRPETGSDHPERTDARYCVYDEPHRDYVYTDAWIRKLTTELSDPATFEEVIGHAPIALPNAQTDMVDDGDDVLDTAA